MMTFSDQLGDVYIISPGWGITFRAFKLEVHASNFGLGGLYPEL